MMTKAKENKSVIKRMLRSGDFKFTEDGNRITISVSDDKTRILQEITIEDTSVRFSTEKVEKTDSNLFEEASESMMKINSKIRHGFFLVDPKTGGISFKTSVHCDKDPISKNDARFHFELGFLMVLNMEKRMEQLDIPPIGNVRGPADGSFYS